MDQIIRGSESVRTRRPCRAYEVVQNGNRLRKASLRKIPLNDNQSSVLIDEKFYVGIANSEMVLNHTNALQPSHAEVS